MVQVEARQKKNTSNRIFPFNGLISTKRLNKQQPTLAPKKKFGAQNIFEIRAQCMLAVYDALPPFHSAITVAAIM